MKTEQELKKIVEKKYDEIARQTMAMDLQGLIMISLLGMKHLML